MVVGDLETARALSGQGSDVVLVVGPGSEAVPLAAAGPGRVAVLVGDPADPAVTAAAAEMDAELFGPRG